MARISNSELVEKLESLDFEQYLQIEGIAFRRTTGKSGRELNIRECPTCGNHSWKVYFNPKTNVGVCFAGSHPQDEQFNTYRFLKEYSGLRGRDLNGYIDSQLLEQGWQPKKKEVVLESGVDLKREVQLPMHFELPLPDGRLPTYLDERNITADLVKYFDLSFITNASHVYRDYSGKVSTQDFSMRVLIPIYDLSGELSTFQGRDVTGQAEKNIYFHQHYLRRVDFFITATTPWGKAPSLFLKARSMFTQQKEPFLGKSH